MPTEQCSAPEDGYRLRFPADWYVNDPSTASPCRFFHPEPFDLPRNTEATGLAIVVQINDRTFDSIVPTGDNLGVEVLRRRDALVAGNQAVRVETRATGRALLPEGVRAVTYYVDFGSDTLVATTADTAAAGTFSENTRVLDDMMATLTQIGSEPACSAAGLAPAAPPTPQLPSSVAATRAAIIDAAIACDYRTLAEIALRGDRRFTYSFGQPGNPEPAEFWRQAEDRGEAVLETLVRILRLPSTTRQLDASTQYLWPSAFGYERWDDVPEADRRALREVYSEDVLQRFQEFGSYVGDRVGIDGTGEWLFFVAGD